MTNILVVAAHPDDEILGCGSKIINAIKNRENIYVLFLTNGARELSKVNTFREKEAVNALTYLGLSKKNIIFLHFPILSFVDKNVAKKTFDLFSKDISKLKVDEIYVPAYEGGHFDHDFANFIVNLWSNKKNIKLIEYPEYSNCINFKTLISKLLKNHKYFINNRSKTFYFKSSKDESLMKYKALEFYSSQNLKFLNSRTLDYDLYRENVKYNYNKLPYNLYLSSIFYRTLAVLLFPYHLVSGIKSSDWIKSKSLYKGDATFSKFKEVVSYLEEFK